jgi:hypothetical protein
MPVTVSYSFSFNSIIFGGTGSPYQILSVDGLEGIPQIRNQDDNRGYADGMFSGQDFLAGRSITITFLTLATSGGNSAQTNLNLIQNKLLPQGSGTAPLYFILPPSSEQFINARVRSFVTTVNPEYTYGYITSQVTFFCPNPTYFDNVSQFASLAVAPPLGRTYNRVYNLVYGGGGSGAVTTVTNNGRWTAYPTITLTGPVTNPTFGNTTEGKSLTFTGTFINTDTLVIDLYNKLITKNGVAARSLLTSGEWFSAQVGTNAFYFSGTGTSPGVTSATVQWYNTYI